MFAIELGATGRNDDEAGDWLTAITIGDDEVVVVVMTRGTSCCLSSSVQNSFYQMLIEP